MIYHFNRFVIASTNKLWNFIKALKHQTAFAYLYAMIKQKEDVRWSLENNRQIDALSNGWRHLAEKASPFYGRCPTICMLVLPSFDGQTSAETRS